MKIRSTMVVLVCFLVTFIFGCKQQTIQPTIRTHLGTERVFDKNYEIGQKLEVYVGQPIVKVKDYKVKKFSASIVRPSSDFILTWNLPTAHGTIKASKDQDYKVSGKTTVDGESYRLIWIQSTTGSYHGILLNDDGSIKSSILMFTMHMYGKNNLITLRHKLNINPSHVNFLNVDDKEIDVSSGYLNYELVYGGTDGDSITISYREYTSENLARPAFYQNVVYESGKKQIRFRDTILQIHKATSEKIVYTVINDGLSK